ncbi:hypothetical protein WR25_22815 [Diploscapter pachys]|uniref:Uncharacterized protein n=1 Tax=Diploscapter pachys TaxID=2018661 RepID=A0A2A2JJL7_9BILA|nr:hypothetical protein WR25_22815 [Diploscapter pachys]
MHTTAIESIFSPSSSNNNSNSDDRLEDLHEAINKKYEKVHGSELDFVEESLRWVAVQTRLENYFKLIDWITHQQTDASMDKNVNKTVDTYKKFLSKMSFYTIRPDERKNVISSFLKKLKPEELEKLSKFLQLIEVKMDELSIGKDPEETALIPENFTTTTSSSILAADDMDMTTVPWWATTTPPWYYTTTQRSFFGSMLGGVGKIAGGHKKKQKPPKQEIHIHIDGGSGNKIKATAYWTTTKRPGFIRRAWNKIKG